jgi:DNA-binding NtrC family response regulator
VLPTPETTGSVVLHEVGLLTLEDQRRLYDWLEHSASRPRIVCTSSEPLFARVQAGRFLARLFYRLNTVTHVID